MKTILFGAILVTATGPPLLANTHTNEATNDWLALDEQLESMASSLQSGGGGVDVGAVVRTYYRHSSDFEDPGGGDVGGFTLENARLYAQGAYGSFDWRFSFGFAEVPFEADDPTANASPVLGAGAVPLDAPPVDQRLEAELLDAYARWRLTDLFAIQFGNLNARDSFSGGVDPQGLLFPQRTFLGQLNHEWDLGLQVEGGYGDPEQPSIEWSFAVLNGDDGTQDDLDLRARVDIQVAGKGGSMVEGALAPDGQLGGSLGLFWSDDGDIGQTGVGGTIWGADYRASYGALGFVAEYARFDADAATAAAQTLFFSDAPASAEDVDYWSVTGSALLGEGFEVAARWEDIGISTDDTRLTLGLNYYMANHDLKWQLAWVDLGSDDPARDGSVWQLGLTAALNTSSR